MTQVLKGLGTVVVSRLKSTSAGKAVHAFVQHPTTQAVIDKSVDVAQSTARRGVVELVVALTNLNTETADKRRDQES